jgi:hypothetical protein
MINEDLLKNIISKHGKIVEDYLTTEGKYKENIDFLLKNGSKEDFKNLELMINGIEKLFVEIDEILKISSGFRNPTRNKQVGGVKNSLHTRCLAVDFLDLDGELDNWFIENRDFLKDNGYAIEHPFYTKNWCHFQVITPPSKRNVFVPYAGKVKKGCCDERFKCEYQ